MFVVLGGNRKSGSELTGTYPKIRISFLATVSNFQERIHIISEMMRIYLWTSFSWINYPMGHIFSRLVGLIFCQACHIPSCRPTPCCVKFVMSASSSLFCAALSLLFIQCAFSFHFDVVYLAEHDSE